MPDEPLPAPTIQEFTAKIVAAYVRRNPVQPNQLPLLISTVYATLRQLGQPAEPVQAERTPAVPIRQSVGRGFVVCLECGWRGRVLRSHLRSAHKLSADEYRARWGLRREHTLVAPAYAELRSALAKRLGLGRRRRGAVR